MKLAVLITCHNRRDTTLACLHALFLCPLPDGVLLEVFLVDDGSSDGTGEAVKAAFPQVHLLEGDGNLYWNGGMRKAFAAAMEYDFDYYLWLNDDTFLYPQTLSTLLQVAETMQNTQSRTAIVVGSTQSNQGGRANHGGIVKWRKLNSQLVEPRDIPVPCETMYGNCVLIPAEVVKRIGNLDPAFVHSIGDIDYGLRARKAGFDSVVMPGFAGTCEVNPVSSTCNDKTLSLRVRFEKMLGPKGLPLKPWFIFLWRHFGFFGLLYWVWTYTKIVLTWPIARLKGFLDAP